MCGHKITPGILSSYVNFYFDKNDWFYCQDDSVSMPKLQAEGAAKVWNLLLDHQAALLADEVGMGKTIEALSVIATLWRQKPDAKVLLYAPNDNVARHWIREYNNFVRYHYRTSDDIVKSSISNEPLRKAVFCRNHVELLKNASEQWPSFLVCKTSSLSGLASDRINWALLENIGINIKKKGISRSEERKWMRDFSFESNDFLYEKLSQNGGCPFDLLVFDEAHYLRRTDGEDSNRSIVAHAFFAGRDIARPNNSCEFRPLAKMVLLMTATPNHSSRSDIKNIVGLFKPDFKIKEAEDILKMICVRRLRRLEGKTKHEYRDEQSVEVKLDTLSEKLFFAAYHKSLVDYRARNADKSKQNNPYRILWGYLEGFEFLPRKKEENKVKIHKDDSGSGGDFSEREDSGVIMDLSLKYLKAYGVPPEHPKYNRITDDLTPLNPADFRIEKKLVFVRRIPSVKEIAGRVINNYDKLFLSILKSALLKKEPEKVSSYNLRKIFWNLSQSDVESPSENDVTYQEEKSEKIDEEIPYSEVLDLFTIKKEGKYRTTDCSNFRVRFTRKEQFFSLFFEPSVDYKGGTYCFRTVYESSGRRNYKDTAQFERISKIENKQIRLILETQYGISIEPKDKTELKQTFDTLLSIWYKIEFKSDKLKLLKKKAQQEYESWNLSEKEGFSNYLEKGILFSSPFIIHFYSYYSRIKKEHPEKRGEELYLEFCSLIRKNIEESGLAEIIARAVLTFRLFYKKQMGLTSDKLVDEKWTFLNHTYPVYPYHAATKRESIIQAFNTPFFPYALIATSVLQEGVDLHYHCSEVIHYGIAWTQGDNEQRVGRVDRLFGKLDNELKENSSARLPIYYPYLSETIDQDQLCRFIMRKYESEMLIDQFKDIEIPPDINYQTRIEKAALQKFLRTPGKAKAVEEPYAVKPGYDFININEHVDKGGERRSLKEMVGSLLNTIKKSFGEELVASSDEFSDDINPSLCIIKHIREKNNRHQPVIFEMEYFEAGINYINRPVYCLRIKTPLAKKWEKFSDNRKFGLLRKGYYAAPMLKICGDEKTNDKYKLYICSEIPFFQVDRNECNISSSEILTIIRQLIEFSDDLEYKIQQADIRNEEVQSSGELSVKDKWENLTEDRTAFQNVNGWKNSINRQFLMKEEIRSERYSSIESYIFNHENKFVRILGGSSSSVLQVGIYKKDALSLETQLLDSVFKNIHSMASR